MKPIYSQTLFERLNYPENITEIAASNIFQPLPAPTGVAPFRFNAYTLVTNKPNFKFILAADTGGVIDSSPETMVATEMAKHAPDFMYIMGDVVYFYGEQSNYYTEFFKPYEKISAPIFAIPGNHDGDLNSVPPKGTKPKSLDAFMKVFCDKKVSVIPFSNEIKRTSITQPNVYFTLEFQTFSIIGLYTNVPSGGIVHPDQQAWFVGELKNAAANKKKIIVTLHHPAYSFDTSHGASTAMQTLLDTSFKQAGVYPAGVFCGHVHNYQRFEKNYGGVKVPYIVSGNGGYHNLHIVDKTKVTKLPTAFDATTNLLAYNDTGYGFLELTTSGTSIQISQYASPLGGSFSLADSFII